jgi:hypothetical protein
MLQEQEKKKALYIIHNSETRQCAEFLSGLIANLAEGGIPINALVIEDKKFATYPDENKHTKNKILYIGDFPESRVVSTSVEFNNELRLNKYGIRYGWHGNKAVISFDRKSVSEADFREMANFAHFNFDGYDMYANVGEGGFGDGVADFWAARTTFEKIAISTGGAILAAIGVIGGVLLVAGDSTEGSNKD